MIMQLIGLVLLPLLIQPSLTTVTLNAKQEMRTQRDARNSDASIAREVRHELMMVPWYSVFDNLQYGVNGDEVTLSGQVVDPTLKSDAENAVKHIEGVSRVNNRIEVLPLSPSDDQIRRAEYRAIYSQPNLQRYGVGNLQSIHIIIVKGGHVTLEGTVGCQQGKEATEIYAKSVPGVFSVGNHLTVTGSK
jgi:hyperosmotically inducible protein